MPNLVDLPPELIERIFIHHETVLDRRPWDIDPDSETEIVAPLFRLTNRYIEQCTRREFAARYFSKWTIRAPDDGNIGKFCAMARFSELAKCVFTLTLYVGNEGEMYTQGEITPLPAGNDGETDTGDESNTLQAANDGEMYTQTGETSLLAGNAGEMDTQSGSTSLQAGIVSSEGNAGGDATVAQIPPAFLRNKHDIINALQACYNISKLAFRPTPPTHNLKEPSETQVQVYNSITFDMSSSLAYLLSLTEEANLSLGWLYLGPDLIGPSARRCGVTDCAGIAKAGNLLRGLKCLSLRIFLEDDEPVVNYKEVGLRLGRQLQGGIINMPVLKSLTLTFDYNDDGASIHLWDILAKTPTFPMLESLGLYDCHMNIDDFTGFVLKHIVTLKFLQTCLVSLKGFTHGALSKFYDDLSKAPQLEWFCQTGLSRGDPSDRRLIQVPRHFCFPRVVDEEDGFVKIEIDGFWIRWEGRDMVRSLLRELARHY